MKRKASPPLCGDSGKESCVVFRARAASYWGDVEAEPGPLRRLFYDRRSVRLGRVEARCRRGGQGPGGQWAVKLTETWFDSSRKLLQVTQYGSNNGKPIRHFGGQGQGMVGPFSPTGGGDGHSLPAPPSPASSRSDRLSLRPPPSQLLQAHHEDGPTSWPPQRLHICPSLPPGHCSRSQKQAFE